MCAYVAVGRRRQRGAGRHGGVRRRTARCASHLRLFRTTPGDVSVVAANRRHSRQTPLVPYTCAIIMPACVSPAFLTLARVYTAMLQSADSASTPLYSNNLPASPRLRCVLRHTGRCFSSFASRPAIILRPDVSRISVSLNYSCHRARRAFP